MSIFDKLSGRAKKAAGDITKDPSLRNQGQREEDKGEAKEDLYETEKKADAQRQEVENLEDRT